VFVASGPSRRKQVTALQRKPLNSQNQNYFPYSRAPESSTHPDLQHTLSAQLSECFSSPSTRNVWQANIKQVVRSLKSLSQVRRR